MIMTKILTEKQAFLAMFTFLENYYNLSKADDVGALLTGLSLMRDGKPFDSAFWEDWKKSVQKALDDEVDAEMRLSGGNSPTT